MTVPPMRPSPAVFPRRWRRRISCRRRGRSPAPAPGPRPRWCWSGKKDGRGPRAVAGRSPVPPHRSWPLRHRRPGSRHPRGRHRMARFAGAVPGAPGRGRPGQRGYRGRVPGRRLRCQCHGADRARQIAGWLPSQRGDQADERIQRAIRLAPDDARVVFGRCLDLARRFAAHFLEPDGRHCSGRYGSVIRISGRLWSTPPEASSARPPGAPAPRASPSRSRTSGAPTVS